MGKPAYGFWWDAHINQFSPYYGLTKPRLVCCVISIMPLVLIIYIFSIIIYKFQKIIYEF
jgi:hypothetical protein